MKLTPRQRMVVDKLNNGWFLQDIDGQWWLRKLRGSGLMWIHGSTARGLRVKRILVEESCTETITYELTEKGKAL